MDPPDSVAKSDSVAGQAGKAELGVHLPFLGGVSQLPRGQHIPGVTHGSLDLNWEKSD